MRPGPLLLVLSVLSVLAALALTWLARGTSSPSGERPGHESKRARPLDPRTEGPTLEGAPEREAGDEEAFDLGDFETMEDFLAYHRPRRIHGRVVDVEGTPARGAVLWVDPAPAGSRPTTMVDDEGRFTLHLPLPNAMPAGTYTVAARGSEGGVATLEVGVGEVGEELQVGDLVLRDEGVITGRVVDEEGRGLARVRVRAYDEKGAVLEMFEQGRRVLIGTDDVLTDEEGGFSLRGLLPHPHWVRVELVLRPGQRVVPEDVRGVEPGGDALAFRLVARARVGGRIFDARSGAPIRRFQLNGIPRSDPDGRFEADLPAHGRLRVSARGYHAHEVTDLELREGDALPDVSVGLTADPEVGTLVVVGRDAEGAPLGGFAVRGAGRDFVLWEEPSPGPDVSELRVEGLEPGEHTFWTTGEGLSSARARATVEVGGERRVEVVLARGGSIELRVLDAGGDVVRGLGLEVLDSTGSPVLYHFAYATPHQGTLLLVTEVMGPQRQQLAAAEGRLKGLPEGAYTLRLHGPGDRSSRFDVPLAVPRSGVVEKTVRLPREESER